MIAISVGTNNSKRRRAESFEACCQRALLNVQISTLLFTLTLHKYTYPLVSKVHAGSLRVSVIHRTLTRATGALTCVRDHYYACKSIRVGLGTPTASRRNIFDSEKTSHKLYCAPDGVRTRIL